MEKALKLFGVVVTIAGLCWAILEYYDGKDARRKDRSYTLSSSFAHGRGAEARSQVGNIERSFLRQATGTGGMTDFAEFLKRAYSQDPAFSASADYIYDFFQFADACVTGKHCDLATLQILMCDQAQDLSRTLDAVRKLKQHNDRSFGEGLSHFSERCEKL